MKKIHFYANVNNNETTIVRVTEGKKRKKKQHESNNKIKATKTRKVKSNLKRHNNKKGNYLKERHQVPRTQPSLL